MATNKFVYPSNGSESSVCRRLLDDAGIPPRAAQFITGMIVGTDFLRHALGGSRDQTADPMFIDRFARSACSCFRYDTVDAGLVELLLVLSGFLPADWWPVLLPEDRRQRWFRAAQVCAPHENWIERLLQQDVPWGPSLAAVQSEHETLDLVPAVRAFWPQLPLKDMRIWNALDLKVADAVHGKGEIRTGPFKVKTPDFWLAVSPSQSEDVADLILERAAREDDFCFARAFLHVFYGCAAATRQGQGDPIVLGLLGFLGLHPLQSCRPAAKKHFAELARRYHAREDDALLLFAWMTIGMWLVARLPMRGALLTQDDPGDLGEEAKRLLRTADRLLGTARPIVRSGGSVDWDLLDNASKVLRWLGSPWAALRSLYQLMVALPEPCVGPDLRFWCEEGEPDPPEPWVRVPRMYAWVIQSLRSEMEKDGELAEGRAELARFLLERLKSKPVEGAKGGRASTRDPVEIKAEWRVAICAAVAELKVNPDGRGHHVLHQASLKDPDEDVQEAARKAYEVVRHSDGATGGMSPRTLLFRSFWCLRQGHLLALDRVMDEDGAKSTRDREVRKSESEPWF